MILIVTYFYSMMKVEEADMNRNCSTEDSVSV